MTGTAALPGQDADLPGRAAGDAAHAAAGVTAPDADAAVGVTDAAPDDPPAKPVPKLREVILAIDISGTKMSVGLVTMTGELIDRDQLVIDQRLSADGLFDSLIDAVTPLLGRAKDRHHAKPVVVGVGCAGPVSANAELVSPPNIPSWRDFPLRTRLHAATRLPAYGESDTKALTLAEGWLGAAVGKENFMSMVVSTGIGGGIVLNGQLLDGATNNAGHIGHVVVEPNGRRCACGSRGCLEAEASGPSIEQITGRPPTEPTYEIMQRTGRLVGIGVASVCNLLDLDVVVCSGSVALGFGAPFFNAAQDALTEHARLAFSRGCRIVPGRLGDRGPLVGAGAVGIRGLYRRRRGNGAG